MRIRSWMLCGALWGVLSACGGSVSIGFGLDQPLRLGVGESVLLRDEELSIRFVSVDADNRCPSDVTCVMAGEATITVELRKPPAVAARRSLTVPMPDMATYQGYEIRLVELEPYPVSTSAIDPGQYRATLVASQP